MMKLNEEQKKLVEINIKFVYYYARRNAIKYYNLNLEELISIYSLGLCKAAYNFNYTIGSKFIDFASVCMDNELKMSFRKNKVKEIPISEFTNNSESNKDFDSENLFKELQYNPINKLMTNMSIKERLSKLTEREKKIFSLYFVKSKNQESIGKIIGISQRQISTLITRIKNKFKGEIIIWVF